MITLQKFDKEKISIWFHKIGFWFLVIFLIGFFCGNWFAQKLVTVRLQDSVLLGGVVLENKVYDISLRK